MSLRFRLYLFIIVFGSISAITILNRGTIEKLLPHCYHFDVNTSSSERFVYICCKDGHAKYKFRTMEPAKGHGPYAPKEMNWVEMEHEEGK